MSTTDKRFSAGNWSFATEWQRTGGALSYSAAPVLPMVNDNSGWQGWYVSAARRLGDRFQVGAYYGSLKARYTTSTAPSSYQRDSAVSFRYDAGEHVIFKLEAHRIDGTYQTFNTPRIPNPAATRHDSTTVFAAKTTLSF